MDHIQSRAVGFAPDIQLYTLRNANGMTVSISNYGGIITSIFAPDRDGNLTNIVLGHDHLSQYLNAPDKPYLGALVGRFANRIDQGRFQIDGTTYQLATNNGDNHLHGGNIGFDKVVWETLIQEDPQQLVLMYRSPDGEEGYPGNLSVVAKYTLTDENELQLYYFGKSDRKTIFSPTNHSYFNLAGAGNGTVLDHELQLHATQYTPVRGDGIPTGEIASVEGTPLDFTSPKPLGRDITHPLLANVRGYDHNFVCPQSEPGDCSHIASLYHSDSGRRMDVSTDRPGIQLYTANFLDGSLGTADGAPFLKHGGVCLETQHFPNSPNEPSFPSPILEAGKAFKSNTIFRFSAE